MALISNMVIVIPTMTAELVNPLLQKLNTNTAWPRKCIVIDNSETTDLLPIIEVQKFPIEYYKCNQNIGVNAAWNLGGEWAQREAGCSVITFLNDDIVITNKFVERTMAGINTNTRTMGVLSPSTLTYEGAFKMEEQRNYAMVLEKIPGRIGEAFSIRKEIYNSIPKIPEELRIFCGDDWIASCLKKMGLYWYKDLGNIIFHYIGKTVIYAGVRNCLLDEKSIYNRLLSENGIAHWRDMT